MNSVATLEHRHGMGQAVDYTQIDSEGLVRQKQLSQKCQSCGSESEDTLCPKCQKERGGFYGKFGTERKEKGWHQLLKVVTVEGVVVKVNGKEVRKGADHFHALLIKKSLERQYTAHNYECLQHINGRK